MTGITGNRNNDLKGAVSKLATLSESVSKIETLGCRPVRRHREYRQTNPPKFVKIRASIQFHGDISPYSQALAQALGHSVP